MMSLASTKGDMHALMLNLISAGDTLAPNDPVVVNLVARYNVWYTSSLPGGQIIYPPFWNQLAEADPFWTVGTSGIAPDVPESDWYISQCNLWIDSMIKYHDVKNLLQDDKTKARCDLHARLRLMDSNMVVESISTIYSIQSYRMGKYLAGMHLRDEVLAKINALSGGRTTTCTDNVQSTTSGTLTYKSARLLGSLTNRAAKWLEGRMNDTINGLEDGLKGK